MDAVSFAGVSLVAHMGCGFFSLLLRSKSGASWSAPLVHPLTQLLGAAAGADCAWLPVRRHGGFWKNFLFCVPFAALFAPGNLGLRLRPRFFLLRCLGVASGVRRIRDACYAWFNSGYMFHERLLANFTYFLRVVNSDPRRLLSIPQNGDVCTVDPSSCSVSSRGSHSESGHYFYELSM